MQQIGRLVTTIFALAVLLIPPGNRAQAQGCSDAGFCSMNSFTPHGMDSNVVLYDQFTIDASYGAADHAISVVGSSLEFHRAFSRELDIDAKLTTLAQFGNGISTFGVSDLYLNATYNAGKTTRLTLGGKIPFTDGNTTKDGLPLPMDYQASLGTFDLILGLGYDFEQIQLVVALQQPLSQNNNQFVAEDYPAGSPLRQFQSTKDFKRSGDILMRVSYPLHLSENVQLTPGLLPIYHLNNDTFRDTTNAERAIAGSQGLTLNANLHMDYAIDQRSLLQLSIGVPFIVRDARPDGLTRSFVASVEYRVRF